MDRLSNRSDAKEREGGGKGVEDRISVEEEVEEEDGVRGGGGGGGGEEMLNVGAPNGVVGVGGESFEEREGGGIGSALCTGVTYIPLYIQSLGYLHAVMWPNSQTARRHFQQIHRI